MPKCKVVIIYEDNAAGRRAKHFCGGLSVACLFGKSRALSGCGISYPLEGSDHASASWYGVVSL
jgi:hypothetical protein